MIKVKCKQCGKEFKIYKYRKESAKFCSRDCHNKAMTTKSHIIKCLYCNREKITRYESQRYCSHSCRLRDDHPQKINLYNTCLICKNKFKIKSRELNRKYCSKECYTKSAYTFINCKYCHKVIKTTKFKATRRKYCSFNCSVKDNAGEKSRLWLGGKTTFSRKIRNCPEMKLWKKRIFEKDNYICNICGRKGKRLNADHYPLSFGQIISINNIHSYEEAIECKMLWNIDNGRTLCEDCHKNTDTYLKPLSEHRIDANGSAVLRNNGLLCSW